jgi:hypothetical protein
LFVGNGTGWGNPLGSRVGMLTGQGAGCQWTTRDPGYTRACFELLVLLKIFLHKLLFIMAKKKDSDEVSSKSSMKSLKSLAAKASGTLSNLKRKAITIISPKKVKKKWNNEPHDGSSHPSKSKANGKPGTIEDVDDDSDDPGNTSDDAEIVEDPDDDDARAEEAEAGMLPRYKTKLTHMNRKNVEAMDLSSLCLFWTCPSYWLCQWSSLSCLQVLLPRLQVHSPSLSW